MRWGSTAVSPRIIERACVGTVRTRRRLPPHHRTCLRGHGEDAAPICNAVHVQLVVPVGRGDEDAVARQHGEAVDGLEAALLARRPARREGPDAEAARDGGEDNGSPEQWTPGGGEGKRPRTRRLARRRRCVRPRRLRGGACGCLRRRLWSGRSQRGRRRGWRCRAAGGPAEGQGKRRQP